MITKEMLSADGWKDVKGYEGLYQVHRDGYVYSIRKDCILRPGVRGSKTKYLGVTLTKDYICKEYYIHRLVAEAFIPNPLGLTQVNHKDENPLNNSVDNLEWMNCKENVQYSNSQHILVEDIVEGTEKTYFSKRDCMKALHSSHPTITRCCNTGELFRNRYKLYLVKA